MQTYDLAIIGGGINGCGIARDAAGRGLSVALCDQGDLGGATSSASTKLIHGGLRYLEYYEFRLVREALIEREVLLRAAPHIIRPLRFILPHHKGLRSWPILRLGLFLYDHLGGRRLLAPTRSVNLTGDPAGTKLKPIYRHAFEYSDCWVEDARLVVLTARDAADQGADIMTRTKCVAAKRHDDEWQLTMEDVRNGARTTIAARSLVNAGGPWVSNILSEIAGLDLPERIRMVKGSHIVVDRIFDHERAYVFQNSDGRVCFAIPYERDFTLIGTTGEDFEGDPGAARISQGEIDYLLGAVNEYFDEPIKQDKIRWSFAGVRPLYDDGGTKAQEVTRDYVLALNAPKDQPPVLSVYGGKITTYRRLSEEALGRLADNFPLMGPAWTEAKPLPGGDIKVEAFEDWTKSMVGQFAFLDRVLIYRLCRAYGTRVAMLLAGVTKHADLGRDFGAGLSEREVDYLIANEWAETAEDILWRRTKLGLRTTPEQAAALDDYLGSRDKSRTRAPTG